MSQKIITLSKQLANQIAAWEVVERPLSVVKELIENSLDAGATELYIWLENGWIDLIEVRDNGVWIPKDDVALALEKYTTSKISSLQDLYEVMTFGFRWEALASISSVSEFTLKSKTEAEVSWLQLFTAGGDTQNTSDCSQDRGTIVRVENLFFNTPARLNYLKKPRTEYAKILEYVQKVSLAYTDVSFTLTHDSKQIFSFSAHESVKERAYAIYGNDFSENMLDISYEFDGIKITGYITDPKISFPNKNRQSLFVNKRVISSPIIFKSVSDAYNRFIPHGNHPGYILFIDIDPTVVDVNVHPRKLEVRFANESSVFRSVYHGIKNVLEGVSLSEESPLSENPRFNQGAHVGSWFSQKFSSESSQTNQYYTWSGTKFKNYSPYKDVTPNPAQAWIAFSKEVLSSWSVDSSAWWNSPERQNTDLRETPLGRIIGQCHNAYIIVETPDGIKILDQHALAERVIYERLASNSYEPQTQGLLWWISMSLTIAEKDSLDNAYDLFATMWFDIEILSGVNVMINGVPDFISKQDIEKVFKKILSDIGDVWSQSLDEVRHKIWAYTACRSAIKFWDPLSIFEMNKLLFDASLDYSATCPHGRPVVFDMNLDELQKKYER